MSLPAPKLDSRDWNSLVEEARQRITAKCPNWTDFNPSDPGMMLVDLTAWMTETVLYQLNRVPELNYLKFLDLVGLRLRPARPAKTWVFFKVQATPGMEKNLPPVPKETRISTRPQPGSEPITFTTIEDLTLTASIIKQTGSRYQAGAHRPVNEREEIHQLTGELPWPTAIFHLSPGVPPRGTAVPHILYLGDSSLADFPGQAVVEVHVEVGKPIQGSLFIEWQAWDGNNWQGIVPADDTTLGFRRNGMVVFKELPAMKPLAKTALITGQSGSPAAGSTAPAAAPLYWLRARLVGSMIDDVSTLQFKSLKRGLSLEEDKFTVAPRRAFCPAYGLEITPDAKPHTVPVVVLPVAPPLQPIDLTQKFQPFGTRPAVGSLFYIESPLFSRAGALIEIRINLESAFPAELGDLEIQWEYPNAEQSWTPLGVCGPGRVSSNFDFKDGTNAFTRGGRGVIEFNCPNDLASLTIMGQPGSYIRARITAGTFKNVPPASVVATSMALRFSQDIRPWDCSLSENYGEVIERPAGTSFNPFRIEPDLDPAFYLCFDHAPAASGTYSLFLDVLPQLAETSPQNPGELTEPIANNERIIQPEGAILKWEYYSANVWKPLAIGSDGTGNFAHAGFVKFISPGDWQKSVDFGNKMEGCWLRVRWIVAEFLRPPRLQRVLLNGVEVEQRVTVRGARVLGSSDGSPDQSFNLNTAIVEEPELQVRESDDPGEKAANLLRQQSHTRVVPEPDGCWVVWKELRNLYRSGPQDRHFTVHLDSGIFRFGNGIHGQIPPAGRDNVRVIYKLTQGARGNVGANTITVLERNLTGVQSVTNYHPAEGGCDRESLDGVMERGPWEIRHRNRAITADDFVQLAKKASALVGPAECYLDGTLVRVIIVPNDPGDKPQPSRRLVQQVTQFLDARRLINSRVEVLGPVYEAIDVQLDLVLEPLSAARFHEIRLQAEHRLRSMVHPVTGLDGTGWPLGRTLHLSELYYRLEDLPGIDHVDNLRMASSGTGKWQDHITLGDRSYPCFAEVVINQAFD